MTIPTMTRLRWWLRIVGALYLFEGIGLSLAALLEPAHLRFRRD
jgi:hypothetical protein